MARAEVYTEFQPLKEVVLGATYDPAVTDSIADVELKDLLRRVFEETNEDLRYFETLLRQAGVSVKRPEVIFPFRTPEQEKSKVDLQVFDFNFPNHPLMVRDLCGVYGNKILTFFSRSDTRYFENWSTYRIMKDYFIEGAEWLSQPMPPFPRDIREKGYEDLHSDFLLFHAANIIKCGKDLFVSGLTPEFPAGKGTHLGWEWLQRVLGDKFRLNLSPCGGHIDGKISLLRPGLVVCWHPKHLHPKLQKWDKILIPDTHGNIPKELKNIRKKRLFKDFISSYFKEWIGHCDESVFDVNMLSINENQVIVNGYRPEIEKTFRQHGIEIIPMHFRHTHFWDGAMHCLTLDTIREGGQEDYFD